MGSLHTQYKTFEIFSFRVVDIYGMICRLGELMKYAYLAARAGSCSEYCMAEHIFCHYLRARECEENAPGSYFLKSFSIELAVAVESVFDSIAVFGKGRRIENYKVVSTVRHIRQEPESIDGFRPMS